MSEKDIGQTVTDFLNEKDPVCDAMMKLYDMALKSVIVDYGIKDGTDQEVQQQMLEKGIFMVDIEPPDSPQSNGIYVFRRRGRNIVPIAWISEQIIKVGDRDIGVEVQRFDRSTANTITERGEKR